MFRHTLSAEVPQPNKQTNIKVESWEMSKIILIEKIIGVLNDSFRRKPLHNIDRKQQIW